MNKMSSKANLSPVLPLRDIVVFPNMVVPLFVGREKSVKALEIVMSRRGSTGYRFALLDILFTVLLLDKLFDNI